MKKIYLPRHVDSKIKPWQVYTARIIAIGLTALIIINNCERKQMTIDDKLNDETIDNAHCSFNQQLRYQTPIYQNDKTVSDSLKAFAGFCCVEANLCPYHQVYKGNDMCNARIKK